MGGERAVQIKISLRILRVESFRSHNHKLFRKLDSIVLTLISTINSSGQDLWLMRPKTRKQGIWMWSKWLIVCARVTSGSVVPQATFTQEYDQSRPSHSSCWTTHNSYPISFFRLLLRTTHIWKWDAITAEPTQLLRWGPRSSSNPWKISDAPRILSQCTR